MAFRPQESLPDKLKAWIDNPPDYYDMNGAYDKVGLLKSKVIRLKRKIDAVEDDVSAEVDKPRSNEAKKAKIGATRLLKDELSELEAELAIAEMELKKLENQRSMFSAATYRYKMTMEPT